MYQIDLSDKKGLIFGVANRRSIAWAIADRLHQAGAQLAYGYQSERLHGLLRKLTSQQENPLLAQCDVCEDSQLDRLFQQVKDRFGRLDFVVHAIAFAPRATFEAPFVEVSRKDWNVALEVSAYSLVAIAERARQLLTEGGSLTTLTYLAAQRVVPKYNLMGVAKAALEASVRFLAYDLGPQGIRVNAISAGPLRTIAARSIPGFGEMAAKAGRTSMLKRNITHEEVAGLALSLISDQLGSGITGETIFVDAGYNAMGMLLEDQ